MSNLTDMQKRYIWLAGSYPQSVIQQGHGVRGLPLYFAFDEDRTLFLFGYSNPLYWLENRGLFKKLQDEKSYALTEEGERVFASMVLSDWGARHSETFKEAKLKVSHG